MSNYLKWRQSPSEISSKSEELLEIRQGPNRISSKNEELLEMEAGSKQDFQ
jgi:hypothetical protein